MKSKKKKEKLLQLFYSDDGCFGLIGDQIAPFTIYFFRTTCAFFSPVVQGAWFSYCGKRAAYVYKVPGDEAARSHRGYR